jgi:uncharacterized protein YndB with AHSA1/START domain
VERYTVRLEIAAPPETTFETITDHRRYPEFTPLRRVELERRGAEAPNGVGAIRALHLVGPPVREEVVDYEAPARFSYRIVSGVPVRSLVGTVLVAATPHGSLMTYEMVIEPRIRFSGPPLARTMEIAIRRLTAMVAAEAERRVSPGSGERRSTRG